MKVSEHIKEVKNIAIRSIIVFVVLFCITFFLSEYIITELINYYNIVVYAFTPFESINAQIILSIGISLIIFIPYFCTELYLYLKDEFTIYRFYTKITQAYILGVVGFLVGVLWITKLTLLGLFDMSLFENMWSGVTLITFAITTGLIVALAMQLILIIPLLVQIGLVTKEQYYNKRMAFIFIVITIVAIITPTTDAVSLALSVAPFVGATELGFALSKTEVVKE